MTLSLPSAFAAASRSANVPKSATLVAAAASEPLSDGVAAADEQAASAIAEAVISAMVGTIRRRVDVDIRFPLGMARTPKGASATGTRGR
jgi:biotin carboxyl carrier protein